MKTFDRPRERYLPQSSCHREQTVNQADLDKFEAVSLACCHKSDKLSKIGP
jgi:hypothetical protein